MSKRLILIFTLGAIAGIFVTLLNPVNSKLLKLALMVCVTGVWIGFTFFSWKYKPLRFFALILPLLGVIPFVLPSSEIDTAKLRADYVRRMSEFEGTEYHWGGESGRGIDCSGLPRRALRDALLAYGFKHSNGRAFREYVTQWWFDASAKALSEGYRDYTKQLETSGTIKEISYEHLIPGDLAITSNGVHMLAYVGNGLWIQADPGEKSVITMNGRQDNNTWFQMPMTTHRWTILTQH